MSCVDSFLFYNTVRELTILMSEKAKQGSPLHLLHMLTVKSSARERYSKNSSGLWTKQTDQEGDQRDRTWAAYPQTVQPPVFVSSLTSWLSSIDVHIGPFQKDLWVLKLSTGKQIVCHQRTAGRQPIRLLVTWCGSCIGTEKEPIPAGTWRSYP